MSTANTFEREMLALINQERTSRGLNQLKLETQLNDSSENHSSWMLNTDTFSHTGSGGSSATQRMENAGFDLEGSWRTGENIAWQSERGAPGISNDVAQLHQGLMNSPGHRANILKPEFEYIGIGIETGDMQGFDAVMVTQNFAATDAAVLPDTGEPSAPATPVTPVEETPDPEETDTETTGTNVTEPEEPDGETTDTEVTETEDPETETTDTEDTETEEPGTETTDTDETETEEPETETTDADDTEHEEPETETTDADDSETENPETETPDTEVTDSGEPESDCFDVQAFLDEIASFLENLQAQFDHFDWDGTETAGDETGNMDDFDLVTGEDSEQMKDPADTGTFADDGCDFMMFNIFNVDCMMDAA
nr:CAP domain-containing protein [uncultured Ruegeria sp.]